MTYFHRREADYHWRGGVSRSCSGREGVGPPRYGRQTKRVEGIRGRGPGGGAAVAADHRAIRLSVVFNVWKKKFGFGCNLEG